MISIFKDFIVGLWLRLDLIFNCLLKFDGIQYQWNANVAEPDQTAPERVCLKESDQGLEYLHKPLSITSSWLILRKHFAKHIKHKSFGKFFLRFS